MKPPAINHPIGAVFEAARYRVMSRPTLEKIGQLYALAGDLTHYKIVTEIVEGIYILNAYSYDVEKKVKQIILNAAEAVPQYARRDVDINTLSKLGRSVIPAYRIRYWLFTLYDKYPNTILHILDYVPIFFELIVFQRDEINNKDLEPILDSKSLFIKNGDVYYPNIYDAKTENLINDLVDYFYKTPDDLEIIRSIAMRYIHLDPWFFKSVAKFIKGVTEVE